jgi:hypothetical protein
MRIRKSTTMGKFLYKLSHLLYRLSRVIWRILIVCNHCGRDVGFNSVVSKYGFNCWDCHNRLQREG